MAGKNVIVDAVADQVEGLTKKQAGEVVDAVFEGIREMLAAGGRVQVPGFGSFSVSERAKRIGRNPATGEELVIPARTVALFKPSKILVASLPGNPTRQEHPKDKKKRQEEERKEKEREETKKAAR